MIKSYIYTMIYDLLRILIYLCLGLIVINYIFGSPLYLDSINDINTIDIEENINQINNSQENPFINDTWLEKSRVWLYWRLFMNKSDRYHSFSDFRRAWTPEFSIRKMIIKELKEFKNNPINYVKEDRNYLRTRILEDNRLYEIKKSHNYLEGYGWLGKSEIDSLAKKGYKILNSKIVKINK